MTPLITFAALLLARNHSSFGILHTGRACDFLYWNARDNCGRYPAQSNTNHIMSLSTASVV
jgi:hypothetical protein